MKGTDDIVLIPAPSENSLEKKEIVTMPDANAVDIVEKTFCKGKIMYGIEDIRLADTIVADKTIDPRGELEIRLGIILEIGKGQPFNMHKYRSFL